MQESKFDSSLEILTSKHTKVECSPKKFDFSQADYETGLGTSAAEVSAVGDISTLAANQCISITIKVITVGESKEVQSRQDKPLTKQDCVVGDSTGRCRVVLWENDVGKLNEGCCYKLTNMLVREYAHVKYLSLSESAVVNPVADIGEVASEDEDLEVEGRNQVNGEIIAVHRVDEYSSCLTCKGKVTSINAVIGECNKCGSKVKMSRCRKSVSVQFIVEDDSRKSWRLTAFNDEVDAIVEGETGATIEEKMLMANKMKFFFSSNDVVRCVKKDQ